MNRTLIKEIPQLIINPIPVMAPWFHFGVNSSQGDIVIQVYR